METTVLLQKNICKYARVYRGWSAVSQTNVMGALASLTMKR